MATQLPAALPAGSPADLTFDLDLLIIGSEGIDLDVLIGSPWTLTAPADLTARIRGHVKPVRDTARIVAAERFTATIRPSE